MTAEIRQAFLEDAEALAEIGAATFIATFGKLYAAKDLNSFLAKNHTADAYRRMLSNPAYGIWLAEDAEQRIVGYAVAGPSSLPAPADAPNAGELMRLYLRKGAQGGGVGARLLETALEFLRDRFERIFLSVYAENRVAQRLYERFGFVKIADYFYAVGEHRDPEWLMELKGV